MSNLKVKSVNPSTLARVAGNIESGICANPVGNAPDPMDPKQWERIATASLEIAIEIIAKVEELSDLSGKG